MKHAFRAGVCAILGMGAVSCVAGSDGVADEPIGEAVEPQIDPGSFDYRAYDLLDQTGGSVARVLVTTTTDRAFAADTEYWNVPSLAALRAARTMTLIAPDRGRRWPREGLSFRWTFHVPHGRWSRAVAPSGTRLVGTDAHGNTVVYDPSGLTQDGSKWGGTMTWWYTDPTVWVSTGGAGSFTMKSGPVPRARWYSIVGVPSTL